MGLTGAHTTFATIQTLISNFRNLTKIRQFDRIRHYLGSRQWEDVIYKIVKR